MSHAFRIHVPQKSAALPSRTGSHMVSNTRSQLSGTVYQGFERRRTPNLSENFVSARRERRKAINAISKRLGLECHDLWHAAVRRATAKVTALPQATRECDLEPENVLFPPNGISIAPVALRRSQDGSSLRSLSNVFPRLGRKFRAAEPTVCCSHRHVVLTLALRRF